MRENASKPFLKKDIRRSYANEQPRGMCANYNLSVNLKNTVYTNSFASGTPSKRTSKRNHYYVLLLSLSAVSQVDGFLCHGYFRLCRLRACVYNTRIPNAIRLKNTYRD